MRDPGQPLAHLGEIGIQCRVLGGANGVFHKHLHLASGGQAPQHLREEQGGDGAFVLGLQAVEDDDVVQTVWGVAPGELGGCLDGVLGEAQLIVALVAGGDTFKISMACSTEGSRTRT